MTKGGTGTYWGLIAALACKNDPMLGPCGELYNKKAGDELYKTVGAVFNASGFSGPNSDYHERVVI